MMLVLDFHTDPNYSKILSKYICKARPMASTNLFYRILTVFWINTPEPVTLGIQLVSLGHSNATLTRGLLDPLVKQEKILGILGDGESYIWELINWLQQKKIFFVIRGKLKHKTKFLTIKYQSCLEKVNTGGSFRLCD